MDQVAMIDALTERAKRVGLTMARVCEQAGVAQSTPSRWRSGASGLTATSFAKLERVVVDAEAVIGSAREAAL